jgi:uncharacterized protein involved in exopolysaccharide biosynthesis
MQTIENHKNYIEEDEIDLRELGRTIWSHKFGILVFSFLITATAILFALSKPNEYESKSLFMPTESAKPSVGGGLAALAGMAGVDIGGSGAVGPEAAFGALLENYDFMKTFIVKYDLHKKLNAPDSDKNYQFALNYNGIYKILKGDGLQKKGESVSDEELIFETFKALSKTIVMTSDKKSAIITVSAKHADATFAKELVEKFLRFASDHLKSQDMKDNDQKIKYYDQEMKRTSDVALKLKLAELESALIQKKVLADANEFYNIKQFTKPEVAYVKDKVGPKRALIVVVAFVTSIILGIFGVFFIEFLKSKPEEANQTFEN